MVRDKGIVMSLHCWCQCQDEERDSGPPSLHCCQGRVMAYCPSHVIIVLSQGRRVRVHWHHCQEEDDGECEGVSSLSGRG